MLLYNVTVCIDSNIYEDWIEWMKNTHIPEVLKTSCFSEARLSRVNGEEEGGFTFSIMYFASSQELYDRYQKEFAPALQKKHLEKFSGKFAAFRTVLNVIEEFKL
jgi:hypothetical protein